MSKPRKLPQRMCVGCREMKDKRQLIRVVRSPDGIVDLDRTGKRSGRGAYVCRNKECLNTAVKSKRLQKALESEIPVTIFEQLAEILRDADE